MSLTIQAVVCAVDFSPFSPLVVRHGAALARRTGVRLYLLHAVNDPQDGVYSTALFERGGDLTHFAEDARTHMRGLMADTLVDWEPVIRFGDPVEETVAFVNSILPSLVIAASHGVSGFRRFFIGTVVERLSRALASPMLVVKPGRIVKKMEFGGFRSIMVSCDEGGYWKRLAPLLSLLRSDHSFDVHLAHTIERPVDIIELDEETAPYNQAQQKLQARLEGLLRNQGEKVFPTADSLSVSVTSGIPQEMILSDAGELKSDLIVVGVRHSGKFVRWISGSTTEALLRQAPCDVLVFPETL